MKNKVLGRELARKRSQSAAFRSRVLTGTMAYVEAVEPRVLLSTYTVNTLSDAANPGAGLTTLRQAVAAANAHAGADSITFSNAAFPAGSLHTIRLLSGQITFTDKTGTTTVTGPGASVAAVDGNGTDRIFNINAGVNVVVSGLTVTHGAAPLTNQGGGIFNAGTLTLGSVVVSKNTASQDSGAPLGGGIYSSGQLTLVKSTVSNNDATAANYIDDIVVNQHHPAYGGGIYSTGTLTITSSTVTGNSVNAGFYFPDSAQPYHKSYYYGDSAAGGGIYCKGSSTITGSTVSSNSAITGNLAPFLSGVGRRTGDALGGGVYAGGILSVVQTTLSGNSALSAGNLTGSPYDSNAVSGGARGGAICATGASVTLASSTITGNKAEGGDGSYAGSGGLGYGGGVFAGHALAILNTTISNNTAQSGLDSAVAGQIAAGGGAYCAGDLSISQSSISGNNAIGGLGAYDRDAGSDARGGGVAVGGQFSVSQSSITGNSATGGNGAYGGYTPNPQPGPGGSGIGGAIWTKGFAVVTGCTISNNAVAGGTGGDASDSGGTSARDGGAADGGGIDADAGLTLLNTTISGNSGLGGAGGVGFIYPSNVYDPQTNLPRPPLAAGNGGEARGGGVFVSGPLMATADSIASNIATGAGASVQGIFAHNALGNGAVGVGGGVWTGGPAALTNCTVANNHALGGGGGDAGISPAGNGGAADGGGIHALVSLKLLDTTVSGNTATAGNGGAGYTSTSSYYSSQPPGKAGAAVGGGVFATKPLFNNTIISANNAGTAFNDVAATALTTSSHNLIGVGGGLVNGINGNKVGVNNPKLSALADHGGPTQTMIPLAGSPAIDAGSNVLIPAGVTTDQRGLPRIFNKTVDIGATEYVSLTLTGNVYNDTNGDGARQPGEVGLSNWQVYIDLSNAGVYIVDDPIVTTNASGNFTLTYSPTSTQPLIVREIRQNTWRRTQPAGIYPLGFYTISPIAGTVTNLNFGDSTTSQVTGTVFRDANANGKQDAGDAGLSGWQILVDCLNNGVWQANKFHTVTDSAGNYSLVLGAGTYRIYEVTQGALHATLPAGGITKLTLAVGSTTTGVNFGNR